jgi:hypothetical protein
MEQMRQEHARELKIRDDKITFLKKQISDSLKDNSWERQQQIEELTKQLKRTHDEYELLRQKLLQYQNKKGVMTNILSINSYLYFIVGITLWKLFGYAYKN